MDALIPGHEGIVSPLSGLPWAIVLVTVSQKAKD
jgi:hypothetical protein